MEISELLTRATETARVQRVFGEPIEHGGALVIPVATVVSGAGGGSGTSPEQDGEGSGGGAGFVVRPTGMYVIRDGDVDWRPAVDVNRIVLGGQLVALAALLLLRSVLRRRR